MRTRPFCLGGGGGGDCAPVQDFPFNKFTDYLLLPMRLATPPQPPRKSLTPLHQNVQMTLFSIINNISE